MDMNVCVYCCNAFNPIESTLYCSLRCGFYDKVDHKGSCMTPKKRAQLSFAGKIMSPKRVALVLKTGFIQNALTFTNECITRGCIAPEHLIPIGTIDAAQTFNRHVTAKKCIQCKGQAIYGSAVKFCSVKCSFYHKIIVSDGCWFLNGPIHFRDAHYRAAPLVWELKTGNKLDNHLTLHRTCGKTACYNLEHLYINEPPYHPTTQNELLTSNVSDALQVLNEYFKQLKDKTDGKN